MTISLGSAGVLHALGASLLFVGVIVSWLRGQRSAALALAAFSAGAAALLTEGVIRSLITGRAPVVGTYENTLVVTVLVAVACVLILRFAALPVRVTLIRLTAPWALGALAFGSRFSAEPLLIGVEGRGALAYVHALAGWLDFTVLLVGTMAAIGMLLTRHENADVWRAITMRLLGAGFALLTATMASGALLSFAVFGSWYQWQIVETLSAVLWVSYGFTLHAILLFGWRDKRLAGLTVVLFPLALATFWVWALYSGTYHYFERMLGS